MKFLKQWTGLGREQSSSEPLLHELERVVPDQEERDRSRFVIEGKKLVKEGWDHRANAPVPLDTLKSRLSLLVH